MKLKNQSGRSMVEMLGVLAIIGVLSVGGIAGYKMAMDQILENKILNLISTFRMSIEIEEGIQDSPYFQELDGVVYETDYFCENYLGKDYCSSAKVNNKEYYFSGKNSYHFYMNPSNYGDVFCLGYRLSSANKDLCRSLVARTYSMDNIVYWNHYHHYTKASKTMEQIQDVLCRTENDGGKGEHGIDFCFY